MIVDFILDAVEGMLRGIIGWFPNVGRLESGADAEMPDLMINVVIVSGYVTDLLAFMNYWLPLGTVFWLLSAYLGVLAVLGMVRVIWRLIPGLG